MTREQLTLEEFAQSDQGEADAASDPQILTVSDLNKMIRQSLEGQFGLIWVKAEISNFKPHSSGHFYFSLKDDGSQISAVMFRGFNSRLKFKPENGMEVVVRGRVTVYEPRGSYQIFCELMEPVGVGALQLAYEQLKEKLKAEGLFDPSRKKQLPFMPKRIVIVTSPTGAAIRDMLNVLSRRARGLEVTIIPAVVQGAQAPAEIVRAIELAQKVGGFDVMIVGRGGGSMEDLWGFNDERVARAIANCKIPVISAVGHEVDFTISDFVADMRAPTPSAAAELVVRNATDLLEKLSLIQARLVGLVNKNIQLDKRQLQALEKGLVDPKRRLQDFALRLDELIQRLDLATHHLVEDKRQLVVILRHRLGDPAAKLQLAHQKLMRLSDLLDSLSPLKVVGRGYSIVKKDHEVIKESAQLRVGDSVRMQFARGYAKAKIEELE